MSRITTPGPTGILSLSTVTSIFTSTASDGHIITITETNINQTLSPNNNTNSNKDSQFFHNTGAVAGVFVVVGLAAASILLWILFAVRRRRRTRRIEHDTAVSATLAAAGFHRTPLNDDDDDLNNHPRSRYGSPAVEMHQRSSTGSGFASAAPSGTRTSHGYMDVPYPDDPEAFNPYQDYVVPPNAAIPSGANPPPVAFYNGPYRSRNASVGSGSAGDHGNRHSASQSGSYEPLLANYYRPSTSPPLASPPLPTAGPPNPPPRNPARLSDAGRGPSTIVHPQNISPGDSLPKGGSSVYSADSVGDDRLDPGLRQRLNADTFERDLRDDEDYSRPVLGVSLP
ncbi:hypothetical protein DXG03_006991 [Asterophora parasitica]|uniref:Uncharacterized protein n=1 Tax=Asterophora parasitica TaxID=117018 RepID=A0A9P7GCC7_9AGAR|nr:hypothetical protein DXG03_006991 [Asterophora parasitica]